MRPTYAALVLSIALLTSCGTRSLPRVTVLPDQTIPHRLAVDVDAVIWARGTDGQFRQVAVHLPAGWWVASPAVVEK